MLQPATARSAGRLVIIDLGLACAFEERDSSGLENFKCAELPRAGSADYFSPQKAEVFSNEREQLGNEYLEEKADLWAAALAIVCFLTDKSPKVALYENLGMDEFSWGDITQTTLGHLKECDTDIKLQEVSRYVNGTLQQFYDEEIKGKIGVKSMEETFWGDCKIILMQLGYIFRRYKIETPEGILDHLNVDNSQDLFFPTGKVKNGAGVFDERFLINEILDLA